MEIEIYEFLIQNYLKGNEKSCDNNILSDPIDKSNIDEKKIYRFSEETENLEYIDNCVFSSDPIGNVKYQSGGFDYDKFVTHYMTIPPNTILQNFLASEDKNVKDALSVIYNNYDNLDTLIKKSIEVYQVNYNLNREEMIEEEGFIYTWNLEGTSKIITFGDFHGSFHTFFRHIERFILLGILDKNFNIINKDYKFLFLGDILDRGLALEIMIIILKIIINNPENIVLNRGNHETHEVYTRESNSSISFISEIKLKLNNYKEVENLFKEFFMYCPSATIIRINSRKIWCCHGCIPTYDLYKRDIKKVFQEKIDIKDKNYLSGNRRVYDFQNFQDNVIKVSKNVADQIRWNDISLEKKRSVFNKARGIGIVLSKNSIREFIEKNEIDFFIRGHQDNNANTVLFGEYDKLEELKISGGSYSIDFTDENLNNDIFENGFNIQKHLLNINQLENIYPSNLLSKHKEFELSNPISRIIINRNNNQDLQIVESQINNEELSYKMNVDGMTISNNTDCGRSLDRDSFIIISYDKEVLDEEIQNRSFTEDFSSSSENSFSSSSENSFSSSSSSDNSSLSLNEITRLNRLPRKYRMSQSNTNLIQDAIKNLKLTGVFKKTKKKKKNKRNKRNKKRISKKVNKEKVKK